MKRFVGVILLILMVFGVVLGLSEEAGSFSFGNEICFGDSVDAVKAKQNGELTKENSTKSESSLRFKIDELLGIKNCILTYYFEEDSLTTILVTLDQNNETYYDPTLLEEGYQKIEDDLTNVYGEPIETDPEKIERHRNSATGSYGYLQGFRFDHLTQRIVSFDLDRNLVIEHTVVHQESKGKVRESYHVLSYQLISKE